MRRRILASLLVLGVGAASFALVFTLTGGYLFRNDGTAYFMYARSLVLDRDTDVANELNDLYARFPADSEVMMAVGFFTLRAPETGRVSLPWPIGSGLVMTPFYALGYAVESAIAVLAGRPVDSYGVIPQYFFGLGSLAYGLLGFWATLLGCRRIADRYPAWLGMLAVVLGGPVVFYVFLHPTMAHASSFGLVALLVLLWWRRWEGERGGMAVLGLLLGLLITIRYQNAIFGLLLAALLVRRVRQDSLSVALRSGAAAGLGALVPLLVQVAHLIATWGSLGAAVGWSAEQDLTVAQNRLDPMSPHFVRVLFSCQHGVFYWAPIWALGFVGLLWAARRAGWARVFTLVFLADVYLVGSLMGGGNWSGGQAFGMRYLTESGPLLAAGLAVLIARARRPLTRRWWAAALALLAAANGLLILAYGLGTISRADCVTYWQMAAGFAEALAKVLGGGLFRGP